MGEQNGIKEKEFDAEEKNKVKKEKLKFRNYIPQDEKLREFCLPRPSVEELEKQIEKEGKEGILGTFKEDILSQIAPKKENWDLKRDLKKKLEILSKRTDRSIIKLIRMKIDEEKKNKNKVNNTENKEESANNVNKNEKETKNKKGENDEEKEENYDEKEDNYNKKEEKASVLLMLNAISNLENLDNKIASEDEEEEEEEDKEEKKKRRGKSL